MSVRKSFSLIFGSTIASSLTLIFAAAHTISAAQAAGPHPAANPKEKMLPVTLVHQDTVAFGKIDLFVSDTGARFVGREGDITITASAPNWDVVLYCKSKNKGLFTSYEEASHSNLGIFTFPLSMSHSKATTIEDKNLHLKVLRIVALPYEYTTASDAVIFQDRNKRVVLDTIIETADLVKMTPQLQRYFDWVYNFKRYTGVPLEMAVHYKGKPAENSYHTTSIEHISKPASFFAHPGGYKPVKNRIDVLISDDANTTLEDLWGSGGDSVKHK